jgi:hypothetical protein
MLKLIETLNPNKRWDPAGVRIKPRKSQKRIHVRCEINYENMEKTKQSPEKTMNK